MLALYFTDKARSGLKKAVKGYFEKWTLHGKIYDLIDSLIQPDLITHPFDLPADKRIFLFAEKLESTAKQKNFKANAGLNIYHVTSPLYRLSYYLAQRHYSPSNDELKNILAEIGRHTDGLRKGADLLERSEYFYTVEARELRSFANRFDRLFIEHLCEMRHPGLCKRLDRLAEKIEPGPDQAEDNTPDRLASLARKIGSLSQFKDPAVFADKVTGLDTDYMNFSGATRHALVSLAQLLRGTHATKDPTPYNIHRQMLELGHALIEAEKRTPAIQTRIVKAPEIKLSTFFENNSLKDLRILTARFKALFPEYVPESSRPANRWQAAPSKVVPLPVLTNE